MERKKEKILLSIKIEFCKTISSLSGHIYHKSFTQFGATYETVFYCGSHSKYKMIHNSQHILLTQAIYFILYDLIYLGVYSI